MIGRLLGHRQVSTAQRYAHPSDDPKRQATENGVCENTAPKNGVIDDRPRVELLRGFQAGVASAIASGGADVRAYYVWSLLDNFEWAFSYSRRFGIVWTDYETRERIPKASARFFQDVIRENGLPDA